MSEFLFGLLAYGPDSADPTIDDIVDDKYKQQVQKVFFIDENQMITCMYNIIIFYPSFDKKVYNILHLMVFWSVYICRLIG